MRTTAKKSPKRVKHRASKQPTTELVHVRGRLERGKVKLSRPVAWSEGQEVVVIPLPPSVSDSAAPPLELLEEDAREFARRPETLAAINRTELD